MTRYILVRVFQGILTTLVIVSLVFLLLRLSGDPLNWLVSKNTTAEVRQQIAANYGLDKPMIVQYGKYLVNICDDVSSVICGGDGTHLYFCRKSKITSGRWPVLP